ncbi:flagellar transcriptional activator FlhD, partial [Citrobacter freundii]
CHFRFDDHQTVTRLTQDSRVDDLANVNVCLFFINTLFSLAVGFT